MRSIRLGVLALGLGLVVGSSSALAEGRVGGGGRLGQVSNGIGQATGSSTPPPSPPPATTNDHRYEDDCQWSNATWCTREATPVYVFGGGGVAPPATVAPVRPASQFQLYAGAQMVHESDGSFSAELSFIDPRFRLDGTLTHYFENQMDGGRITMNVPTLAFGMRFSEASAWLHAGVAHVATHGDPMGSSSIIGPLLGTRLEHPLSRGATVFGIAEAMFFEDDVKAFGGRAGLRFGHVQLSVRVLDFNVGPALYGPELGLRF
jgi:hypothetical protein